MYLYDQEQNRYVCEDHGSSGYLLVHRAPLGRKVKRAIEVMMEILEVQVALVGWVYLAHLVYRALQAHQVFSEDNS